MGSSRVCSDISRFVCLLCWTWLVQAILLNRVCVVVHVMGADESHLVTSLPGQPLVEFDQYAGFITVNESHGRALFYWFFQSQHPPHAAAARPLLLWLNGGPGCSSIGDGALRELGPFFINDSDNGLILNPYSWTRAANIIFLESPYGTGFSYSNTSSDYDNFTDDLTAKDAHAFLVGWFKKFPEYRKNEFYIAGESYAGHYIPTLARAILRANKAHDGFYMNFRGFAVGNPWTDLYSDNLGAVEFYWSHSIISDETYNQIVHYCDLRKSSILLLDPKFDPPCQMAINKQTIDSAHIDQYNVYGHYCSNKPNTSSSLSKKSRKFLIPLKGQDPCQNWVTTYLNNRKVQSALHVTPPMAWTNCGSLSDTNYSMEDFYQSMVPIYHELLKEDLRIWIYSGDADGIVPTLGTRKWIEDLDLPVERSWYAWNYKNQVGGWTQKYKGLTLVTIRGAGHLVPAVKPGPALALFESFLHGQPLPEIQ